MDLFTSEGGRGAYFQAAYTVCQKKSLHRDKITKSCEKCIDF